MKVEATEALPDIRFLDEAARAAQMIGWYQVEHLTADPVHRSLLAHARSLERIEQLERERDEAREYGAQARIRENAAEQERISQSFRAEKAERQRHAAMKALRRIAAFREKPIEGCAADRAQCIGWNSAGRYSRDVATQALAQIDAITEGEGL